MYSFNSRGEHWRDLMEVCMSGHIIHRAKHRYNPKSPQMFCKTCREKTITTCPNCDKAIPSDINAKNPPAFCTYCSEPFPWKDKIERQNRMKSLKSKAEKPLEMLQIERLQKILSKFHSVVQKLRDRRNNRETLDVKDEYDVQDLLRALLVIDFDDIRPEESTPSHAGQSARMDFLLKKERIVVEVKTTRKGLSDKEIGNQLIVDIEKYKNHPDCDTLICFIYDPISNIRNKKGLITDLEGKSSNQLKVMVIINPY